MKLNPTLKRALVHFTYAFAITLLGALTGIGVFPDLETLRAFLMAGVVGAFAAGCRAVEAVLKSSAPQTLVITDSDGKEIEITPEA